MPASIIRVLVLALGSLTVAHAARRSAPDNTVSIGSETDFCIVTPRDDYTDIGDSEHPGGMQVACTRPTDSSQGRLPQNMMTSVSVVDGYGSGAYRQLTGCFEPSRYRKFDPRDPGGQYDDLGGDGGRGNPAGSSCTGYNAYVEIVEPSQNRLCIRCCEDPADCPLTNDRDGCPAVVPGRYDGCEH